MFFVFLKFVFEVDFEENGLKKCRKSKVESKKKTKIKISQKSNVLKSNVKCKITADYFVCSLSLGSQIKKCRKSKVLKYNESSFSFGLPRASQRHAGVRFFCHRFSQIKRIKKICASAVKLCFFCFSYMPFVVKNFANLA